MSWSHLISLPAALSFVLMYLGSKASLRESEVFIVSPEGCTHQQAKVTLVKLTEERELPPEVPFLLIDVISLQLQHPNKWSLCPRKQRAQL